MLVHPFAQKELLEAYEGTRLLKEDFGIVGLQFREDAEPGRMWEIKALYAPVPGRHLGGLRARLEDNHKFVSFLNQRDLEVLLGLGTPGRPCIWTRDDYPEPGSREWYGLCADEDDLEDDLLDRELLLRGESPDWRLPPGLELTRRIHLGERNDVEELLMLRLDMDEDTGISPDPRLSTISRRWVCIERRRTAWQFIY